MVKTSVEPSYHSTLSRASGAMPDDATIITTKPRPRMTQPMAILNEVPNAALDALELERSRDDPNLLTGRLRVSFFFRGED